MKFPFPQDDNAWLNSGFEAAKYSISFDPY